jgi:hypothetical protein
MALGFPYVSFFKNHSFFERKHVMYIPFLAPFCLKDKGGMTIFRRGRSRSGGRAGGWGLLFLCFYNDFYLKGLFSQNFGVRS